MEKPESVRNTPPQLQSPDLGLPLLISSALTLMVQILRISKKGVVSAVRKGGTCQAALNTVRKSSQVTCGYEANITRMGYGSLC